MGAPAGELSPGNAGEGVSAAAAAAGEGGGSDRLGGLVPALAGWLAARVAVALGVSVAHLLSGRVELPHGRLHLDQGLMTWDGTFYRVLAEGWYGGAATPADASRFFPLYPAMARVVDRVLPGGADVALLVLANLAALAAALVVWRLALEVLDDRGVADRAAWMLAVVPAANVYVFAYSESLMALVVALALLALHRRRLLLVAVFGLVAGLLRPAGVLVAVPVAVAAWQWWQGRDDAGGARSITDSAPASAPARVRGWMWAPAVLSPVVGLLGALAVIAGPGGDLAEPFRWQRELRGGFRDPVTRLGEALVDIASGRLHDVYNLAFAVGFALLIVVAWRRRQPAPWVALMVVTWVVAVGGNNMDSLGRYCTVAAPFTVALAQWAQRRWQQVAVAVIGLGATAWYTAEVLLGRIIP